jgi:16S rRNA C967 or C1407 C5-methylase (RsmB/RsmF family)
MADVDTLYGTFSEDDLKAIKNSISEMSNEMSIIEGHKEAIKDIVDAVYDKYKLPKKIINRLAKAYHKQSFQEEVQLDNEFEAIYVGVTEAK